MNSLNEVEVEVGSILSMREPKALQVHGGSAPILHSGLKTDKVKPHPEIHIKEEQIEGEPACASNLKLKRKVIEEERCSPSTPNKPGYYVRRKQYSTGQDDSDSRDGRHEFEETIHKDCHSRDNDGSRPRGSHDGSHRFRDRQRESPAWERDRVFQEFKRYYDKILQEHSQESPSRDDGAHGFQEFKRYSDQKHNMRDSPASGLHGFRRDSRSSSSIARDTGRGCEEFKLYSDRDHMHKSPSRDAGRGREEFNCYSDQDRKQKSPSPSRSRDEGRRVQEFKHNTGHNDHHMQESPSRDGGRAFRDHDMNHESPSRDKHRRRPSVSLPVVKGRDQRSSRRDKEEEKLKTHSKIEERLLSIPLLVNGVGEPQGKCENVVSKMLATVVNDYLSPTVTWSSVSAEMKYEIGQKLQKMFKEGSKLSQKWIQQRARKLLDSARERAKNQLWRNQFKSAEEDFLDDIDDFSNGYSPRGSSPT